MSEEDDIIKDIEAFSGENGIPEVSLDYFPKSSVRYYSAKEVVEKNKDTLSALFGALEEMDRKLEKSDEIDRKRAEEMGIVEEYFDEETSDEELVLEDKDIKELISEEIAEEKPSKPSIVISNLEKKEVELLETKRVQKPIIDKEEPFEELEDFDIDDTLDISDNFDEEIKEEIEDIEEEPKINNSIDTSFLLDEDEESEEEEPKEVEESKQYYRDSFEIDSDLENEDEYYDNRYREPLSMNETSYQEDDNSEDYDLDIEDDFQEHVNQKNFNQFFDDNDMEDTTGYELEEDLRDEEESLLRDTDPRKQNAFEEAANYFLTGKSQSYNDDSLKKLYKSKERIVKAEGVNDTDDGLAKMVLALSDGLINLPHFTSGLFRKAKKSGKKMRETMIVEGDEDDDF